MTGQPNTVASDMPQQRPQQDRVPDAAELVLEDRFSIVPEWVLDADIGDCAVRLYAVLLRYGNTTGARMPCRATLAARLHKKSVDTVDRALADLVRPAPSRSRTGSPAASGSPTATGSARPIPVV